MQCDNCHTINDSDGKFCKNCGEMLKRPMPEMDALFDVDLKIGEMIYLAYNHRDAGRFDDAILACQGALALKSSSAPTHSLLASLYELKGDLASAILQYEIVLSLDPNNPDGGKLYQLRAKQNASSLNIKMKLMSILRPVKPFAPYIVAAGVFCCMLALGLNLIGRSNSEKKASVSTQNAQPSATQYSAEQQYPQSQYTSPQTGAMQPAPQASAAPAQTVTPQVAQSMPVSSGVPPVPVAKTFNLPAYTKPTQSRAAITPVINPLPVRNAPPKEEPAIVPVIEASEPPAQSQRNLSAVTPPQSESKWQPTGTPAQKALKYQQAGMYKEAISAYREAIKQVGDNGRLYQQIALCYQRLGQNTKAIDSYNQAINQYKRQQSDGRSPAEVQHGITSCEAGIQAIKSSGN